MPAPAPRSPTAIEICTLGVIVVGTVLAVRAGGGATVAGSWPLTATVAAVCAVLFGLPILAFTFERGRATPGWLVGLGAIAGALPLLLLGVSGIIGLYLRSGGWDRPAWALERGMPIPAAGVIFWSRFARLEGQSVLMGLACGLMFWLLMVRTRPETRAINALLALFVLSVVVSVAALLH